MSDLRPDSFMIVNPRPRAHVWVRDGKATLTIITDAPAGFSVDWPEDAGPLVIFDPSFDLTVTAVDR